MPIVTNFMNVKLGVFKTIGEYREELKAQGCEISPSADAMLQSPNFSISTEPVEVELVRVTFPEYRAVNNFTLSEAYSAVYSLGLDLCPHEVGLALRLAYNIRSKEPKDARRANETKGKRKHAKWIWKSRAVLFTA